MPSLPHTLTHLALLIDLLEDRMERTPIPFLRAQIRTELDRLCQRFDTEYHEFMAATGQNHTAQMLRSAA